MYAPIIELLRSLYTSVYNVSCHSGSVNNYSLCITGYYFFSFLLAKFKHYVMLIKKRPERFPKQLDHLHYNFYLNLASVGFWLFSGRCMARGQVAGYKKWVKIFLKSLFLQWTLYLHNKVTESVCLSVPKDFVNRWTDTM